MTDFRLDLPADPRWLGVVRAVTATHLAVTDGGGDDVDDFAWAVEEAALEVAGMAGVERLVLEVDGHECATLTGTGAGPVDEDPVLFQRVLPALASLDVRRATDRIEVELKPRRRP